MTPREPRIDELHGVLDRLDRILSGAVQRLARAVGDQAAGDPFRGLYISVQDAARIAGRGRWSPLLGVSDEEPPVTDVLDAGSRLAALASEHGLSGFDIDVIVVALAPELDLGYGRVYAFLQDDVSRRRPSVDLALNLLCPTIEAKTARREHFAADAPLIAGELITLRADPSGAPEPLLSEVLELDRAVVRHLLGIGGPDTVLRLDSAIVDARPGAEHRPAPTPAARELAPLVTQAHAGREPLRLCFSGPAAGLKRAAAEWLAAQAGVPLCAVDLEGLLHAPDGVRAAARRLLHHARLVEEIVLADGF